MRAKRRGRKLGKGTLLTIGLLFFASGVLRLADGTGIALARGVAGAAPDAATDASVLLDSCDADPEIRATLKVLKRRAEELDSREAAMDHRMQTLRIAEEEIEINLAALISAEESLEATLALAEGAAETDIGRLTAVYENMKPKDASTLFEEMDPTFSAGFLGRMKPDAAAAVLAGMTPAKAYTVSVILAGRNTGVPTE